MEAHAICQVTLSYPTGKYPLVLKVGKQHDNILSCGESLLLKWEDWVRRYNNPGQKFSGLGRGYENCEYGKMLEGIWQ